MEQPSYKTSALTQIAIFSVVSYVLIYGMSLAFLLWRGQNPQIAQVAAAPVYNLVEIFAISYVASRQAYKANGNGSAEPKPKEEQKP